MVIQMVFGNEEEKENKIFRNIIKHTQIAQYREGFYSRQLEYKWGKLFSIKGKVKTLIGQFGNPPREQEAK